MSQKNEDEMLADIRKHLVGRKLKAIQYQTADAARELGWHERAPVLVFDDGSVLFASCDPEGNGPGTFFTDDECVGPMPF